MSKRRSPATAIVLVLAGFALLTGFLAAHDPAKDGKRFHSYAPPLSESISMISGSAPFEPRWARTFQNSFDETSFGWAVVPTGDGGLVTAGRSETSMASYFNSNIWVTEIRPSGKVDWGVIYNSALGEDIDEARAIVRTPDGGYLVAGWAGEDAVGGGVPSPTGGDIFLMKLAHSGHVDWIKEYGGDSNDHGYAMQPTADGGYLIVGGTYSFGLTSGDAWLLKLDSSGNILRQTAIGGPDLDCLYSVQTTQDGGCIAVGSIISTADHASRAWVVKLSSAGGVLWQKVYGDASSNWNVAHSVCAGANGAYLVAGSRGNRSSDGTLISSDVWVWELDTAGRIVWQKAFPVKNTMGHGTMALPTHDGGFLISAGTSDYGDENEYSTDACVLKLNAAGSLRWQKKIGKPGAADGVINGAFEADNANLVLTGSLSHPGTAYHLLVMSLNRNGTLGYSCPFIQDASVNARPTAAVPQAISLAARSTSGFTHSVAYHAISFFTWTYTVCVHAP